MLGDENYTPRFTADEMMGIDTFSNAIGKSSPATTERAYYREKLCTYLGQWMATCMSMEGATMGEFLAVSLYGQVSCVYSYLCIEIVYIGF